MKKLKDLPSLREILLRVVLMRLFIPIMIVTLVGIFVGGYLGLRNLENNQNQIAESVAHIVDYHIEHGQRALDAIARISEISKESEMGAFMESTCKAYGDFETIYYLNGDKKIELMTPDNKLYNGLDMSNLPHLEGLGKDNKLSISRPFISLRTGTPTVYLVRALAHGGYIIGELNLGIFQKEIVNIKGNKINDDYIFIMDHTGTLIAHPSSELVKQQTNMSNLKIFQDQIFNKNANSIYQYDGRIVIGNSVRVKSTGWIVVNQILLSAFFSAYAWIIGIAIIAFLVIWLILVLVIRKELKKYVINPLEQLTLRTNALTIGNYIEENEVVDISNNSVEINKLLVDFNYMSNSLKLRENALRESENRYRGLVDRLPIGIFKAKLTGEVLNINPMFMSIFGYSDDKEVLNTNIINFFSTLSSNNNRKFMIENIHRLNNFEIQLQRQDGNIKWIQISTYIFYDLKTQCKFFEGNIQDITERKEAEAKFNEQQKLRFKAEKIQREALEKALAMKDEFISLISHEFKTPLNVIYSAIQLIECVYLDKIPVRVQELVGNIKQNTFRQLRLTNNLLDITKMNSGQIKLNMKNIDIVFLGKVITKSVEIYAEQKNLKISFISNVKNKVISIDDEKFERIILNLLSNAIKFTDNGGEISVIINEDVKSNLIQIKIQDTGIGIPKDKQELIFERFGQVDNNLSRQAEGTGIGLSLVKLLVNVLDGTIEVESELGVGSTFIITLPIKVSELDNELESFMDVEDRIVSEIKVQFSDIYF